MSSKSLETSDLEDGVTSPLHVTGGCCCSGQCSHLHSETQLLLPSPLTLQIHQASYSSKHILSKLCTHRYLSVQAFITFKNLFG